MTIPQSRLANSQITPTIKQRLERLGIPLDRSVKNALVQYHSSQVLAALNHVQSNFDERPRVAVRRLPSNGGKGMREC